MREIEILVELYTNLEVAKERLSSFDYIGSKETLDVYFYDPLRDNLKLNKNNKLLECCRVRTKQNQHYITYKIDIYDGHVWKYSEEHETEVKDVEAAFSIFKNIGLKELVTVNSIKHIYIHENYEIVLEEVKDLGCFLEVEYCVDEIEKSVEEIKSEIFTFIQSLNLKIGQELNSGKPELLLTKIKF